MKFYYTYVLRSILDKKLYVGCTADLKKRIEMHNKGLVEATKHRKPFVLMYYEACLDKQRAFDRESYFKTGFGRRYLSNRIGNIGE